MKTIRQTYQINSAINEVWKALTLPRYINAWGGGPAKMDDRAGTKFSLWDGEIWGENLEVIENKKLVQEWWSKGELKDKPSVVTFTLRSEDGKVRLNLVQTGVPPEYEKDLDDGWRDFYLLPLKKYLESK